MQFKEIQKTLKLKGFDFRHFEKIDSTMDKIKQLIKEKQSNYFVISEIQKKGRGRRGSFWHSVKGNLYFSFSEKFSIDIKNHFMFNALATLSVSESIDNVCNVKSKIKWPNDVLVNGKKISGIMTEIIKYSNNNYLIIGIGINVDSSPRIPNYPTTFAKELYEDSNQKEIIESFIKYYFNKNKIINNLSFNDILNEYKKKLIYFNKKIKLELDNYSFVEGKFEDINLDGSMVLNIKGKKNNFYSARILNVSN